MVLLLRKAGNALELSLVIPKKKHRGFSQTQDIKNRQKRQKIGSPYRWWRISVWGQLNPRCRIRIVVSVIARRSPNRNDYDFIGMFTFGKHPKCLLMMVGQCWDTFFFDAHFFKAIVASFGCLQLAFAWTAGRSDPKRPSFQVGNNNSSRFRKWHDTRAFFLFLQEEFLRIRRVPTDLNIPHVL